MAISVNQLILDKVRALYANDLSTGEMLYRLKSIEDPSLKCSAEGEEVTDAVGAVITTIYRAKKATFSGTASLLSLDLAAAQFGTKKVSGSAQSKIKTPCVEILTINESGKIVLSNEPVDDIQYIYSMVNDEPSVTYSAGAAVSDTEFTVDKTAKTITVPTGATGKILVKYNYETENAVSVANKASEFPEACELIIEVYFKDVCNENIKYSGYIYCPKAKLNPEQIELALTSTGKHSFEFNMMKDYCAEDGDDELFKIIVAQ